MADRLVLTKRQRAAFFARDWPVLAGKGKPPVSEGYVHRLSSRLSFEVTKVRLRPGGYRLIYKVEDDRDERFFLLPAAASFATDEDSGALATMPPEEEIGFTKNPKRRHADPLPTVPPDVQNVMAMRGRLHDAERDRKENPDREIERDLRRVQSEIRELAKRAAKMGVPVEEVLAPVAREVKHQHEAMREAA